jgi:hypothetical protein
MALHQFLLVYNAATQELLEANDLGPDTGAAIAAYVACEKAHRDNRDIQVVLIGSDSIETIQQTHGHYFGTVDPAEFFETVTA